MISDLLVVITINTQLGCQTVTPCCCNNLFYIRDLIHEEGGEDKNPSVVLFFTWKYTGYAKALGKTYTTFILKS